ncbi:MAG: gliding motility-associated ABC transporter substrate-binding protein GldG [Sphingobacteriales bacterium]|nr:MAG: gliding motility-associated ABC transporter substrate-binding protein GldG [Sphingobacteriales bacterium]
MASVSSASTHASRNRGALVRLLLLVGILLAVNALAVRFHYGFDLTAEKRFTLSTATRKLLNTVDDAAVFTIYLKNDRMGADFQRLADATRDRLESFRSVTGGKLVYQFQNPFDGLADDEAKAKVAQQLAQKGIVGIPFGEGENGDSYTENILFPYAHLVYQGKEITVSLLDNHQGMDRAAVLNYSESQLEYKLARALYLLGRTQQPSIAYLVGNGEALDFRTFDLLTTLPQFYKVDTFDLTQNLYIPAAYSAVILAQPTIPFDDKDKYKLDQYVLGGGRVLMAIDQNTASLDSLAVNEAIMATDRSLNLDDLLFRWGARINANLIEDVRCVRIPVTVGMLNGQPEIDRRPWTYFPVYVPTSHHPIVNNMDGVLSLFGSSIDTIATPDIRKTILLESSPRSRVTAIPTRISLSMLRYKPRPELYNKPYQPAAVLLEGRFRSAFEGRLPEAFLQLLQDSIKRPFRALADTAGAVIVLGDANMVLNQVSEKRGPQELGYWPIDDARFANKAFLLNCLEYLTEPGSPLEARSKESRLRLLDGARVKNERVMWQSLNILLPLALLAVFASAYLFFRKRRYEGRTR